MISLDIIGLEILGVLQQQHTSIILFAITTSHAKRIIEVPLECFEVNWTLRLLFLLQLSPIPSSNTIFLVALKTIKSTGSVYFFV